MGWERYLSSVNSWLLAKGLDFCWRKLSTFCETVLGFYPHNGGREIQARFQMRVFLYPEGWKANPRTLASFFSCSLTRNTHNFWASACKERSAVLRSVQRGANTSQSLMISLDIHYSRFLFCTVLHLPIPQDFLSCGIGIKKQKLSLNKNSPKGYIKLKIMIWKWTYLTF